ncbi:SDR family oxidoreductase [Flagellimonas sp. S3867]|uniref:SDR family oxidoreductase n=1 Tax=Flagellimonas sp. S3867 TaxID=2768063 RepID=UPI0016899F21|nr:SDR family oxidoreductase [Flagellimonas sp. S3867]
MNKDDKWVLIIGGSSGLGLATAQKFAANDYGVIVVHRDRKTDMEEIQNHFQQIAQNASGFHSFNADAINPEKRNETHLSIKQIIGHGKINVLVHSVAKGNLKPMHDDKNTLTNQDFHLTVDAMAINLYDWVKELVGHSMFSDDVRIVAYTSEGNTKAWKNYAAVSAAKVALEAIVRNIALEFADLGIKANCIQAGVTDTKSLRMIPNNEVLKEEALKRNPNNRLTRPEDVANAAYLLSMDEAKWITGTIIKVDGGESLQ